MRCMTDETSVQKLSVMPVIGHADQAQQLNSLGMYLNTFQIMLYLLWHNQSFILTSHEELS